MEAMYRITFTEPLELRHIDKMEYSSLNLYYTKFAIDDHFLEFYLDNKQIKVNLQYVKTIVEL